MTDTAATLHNAVKDTINFYDNLGRPHEKGEARILDKLQDALNAVEGDPIDMRATLSTHTHPVETAHADVQPVRPERVQAAFEVFACKSDTGPNATAMFEYIEHLEAERDRFKFNADEMRKCIKRQSERYQRTISEHIECAGKAEASLTAILTVIKEHTGEDHGLMGIRKLVASLAECQREKEGLREAAANLIANRFDQYKARNGKMSSIEGDDGEKCWIVSFDDMADLEAALAVEGA